jgi:tRNA (guanine-N7-)-methyltransferase
VSDLNRTIVLPEKEILPLEMDRGKKGAEVFLEIGFGNGEFLENLAGENSDGVFWGVEMSRACLMRACRRIQKKGLRNAFLICGDARFILKECIPPRSLQGIFMNFPCPWPKKKHSKRRVSSGEFSAEIARVLRPGGFFELVTDEERYGMEVRDALASHPALSLSVWETNPPREVTTKYERKWLEMGKKIFLSRFLKRDGSCERKSGFFGRSEEVHVRVMGKHDLDSFLGSLYGTEGGVPEGRWVFKKHYVSEDGARLIEVVTTDGGFEQKFFLQAVQREEDVLIKVSPYSAPFLTPSVKDAIEKLAEKLGAPAGEESLCWQC